MCMVEMAIFNIQRAITLKVGNQELWLMCLFCMSSHGVNICVKFHENISSGFKVMERTQKLLTDTHIQKRKLYTPLHAYFVCRGYNQSYGSCILHVVSWFNICVKFRESMSSSFEHMEHTQKNCKHTKGNKSKSRKTRVMVHVFCMSSHDVSHLCEVS